MGEKKPTPEKTGVPGNYTHILLNMAEVQVCFHAMSA